MKQEKQHLEATTEIKDGQMTAIGSTEDEDRVGDVLSVSDWDLAKFKKNPVLQAGHDYNPQFTIGIAKNIRVEGKKLIFEPLFHDITKLSSDIKQMFERKFLRAWSVGFIPGDDKNQLLEISAVAVPANPEALTLYKSMKDLDGKEKKETGDKITKWVQEKGCCDNEALPKKEEDEEEEEKIDEEKEIEINQDNVKEVIGKAVKALKKEKQEYECECLDCSHILKTDKHCEDVKCPECGGKMRRAERPGPGKKEIERWNKDLPASFDTKDFDINREPSVATGAENKLYTKYLNCKVKELNLNNYLIPSPMIGSYLAAFKKTLSKFELVDERNFDWFGSEQPIKYEVIKLNSKEEDDFMISGTGFYRMNDKDKKFMVKFEPTWYGLEANIITHRDDKTWNKDLLISIQKEAIENNKLKGEAFCLSGEFIDRSDVNWKEIILPSVLKGAVQKGVNQLVKNGKKTVRRGMMFIGQPGTGKTLTGKAMMNNLKDKTFIWVSARDFERMKIMKQSTLSLAFKMCRMLSPCVLFMEDIDAWLKDGRMMDMLKTEMDGLQENRGTITVLTSNNPEEFPDALLDRPGRFHDILEFELPDKDLRKNMIMEWTELKDLSNEELKKLLEGTEDFSGAHMRELIDFAKMIVEDDGVELKEALMLSLDKLIKQRELIAKIRKNNEKEKVEEDNEKQNEIEDRSVSKEGRVISGKNRKLIRDAIASLTKSSEALDKLLDISQPLESGGKSNAPVKAKETVDSKLKVVKPKTVDSNLLSGDDQLVLRTLQKINKGTNLVLNKLNKRKNG